MAAYSGRSFVRRHVSNWSRGLINTLPAARSPSDLFVSQPTAILFPIYSGALIYRLCCPQREPIGGRKFESKSGELHTVYTVADSGNEPNLFILHPCKLVEVSRQTSKNDLLFRLKSDRRLTGMYSSPAILSRQFLIYLAVIKRYKIKLRAFNYIYACWVYCLFNVIVLFITYLLSADFTIMVWSCYHV